MSQNIQQIFTANPASSMVSTDLLYLGRSPYNTSDDFAITFANFVASIGASTPTASTIAKYDANSNLSANNFIAAQQTITTAGGTSVLTVASPFTTIISGSSSQTIQMPVVSTLALNQMFLILNNSTLPQIINSSGGNLITTMLTNSSILLMCIAITGTTAASWQLVPMYSTGGNASINELKFGTLMAAGNGSPILSSDGATAIAILNSGGTSVNFMGIVGSVTGADPMIYLPLSADTNVGLEVLAKAAGQFHVNTLSSTPIYFISGTSYQHQSNFTFPNTAATQTYTFPDATGTIALTSNIPAGSPSALTVNPDTNVTIALGGTPATALLQATSITLGWTGLLAVGRGGTGVNSVTTSPTASSFAGWDANKNLSANNFIPGYTSTATAAGTTTLTVASSYEQFFTGSTTQIVQMPVTSTLVQGQSWMITNNSTGNITVNSSGSNTITTIGLNTSCLVTCILTTGTTAASWVFNIIPVVDEWVAYTPTFTGFGTPTTVSFFSRRVGSNLEINGRWTTGTCTAVQAQVTLGYNGTNANVTSSNTVITTLMAAGIVVSTVAGASNIYITIAPNVGYINFGVQNSGNSALAQANATACFNNASLNSLQCSIPIAGW